MESNQHYREVIERMFENLETYNKIVDDDNYEAYVDNYEDDEEAVRLIRELVTDSMLTLMLRKPADLRHKLLGLFN